MYLYFLDFGEFVKVGITINLRSRLAGNKKSFKKDYIYESSYFWKAEGYYISFIEGHIKNIFPNYDFGSIGEKPKGHSEIFDKTYSEEMKGMINNFFQSLKIEHRSGIVDNELKELIGQGYGEDPFETGKVNIDDFFHFITTHKSNVAEIDISRYKEELFPFAEDVDPFADSEEKTKEKVKVYVKLRVKPRKYMLIGENGEYLGGSEGGSRNRFIIHGELLNDKQLERFEQLKNAIR